MQLARWSIAALAPLGNRTALQREHNQNGADRRHGWRCPIGPGRISSEPGRSRSLHPERRLSRCRSRAGAGAAGGWRPDHGQAGGD